MEAIHYIEQWKDRQGNYHLTPVKPLKEFNWAMATSKGYARKKGFRTVAVFFIKYKTD